MKAMIPTSQSDIRICLRHSHVAICLGAVLEFNYMFSMWVTVEASVKCFQTQDLSDKINFYIMGGVTFFKSHWPEIRSNAAMLIGEISFIFLRLSVYILLLLLMPIFYTGICNVSFFVNMLSRIFT